MKLPLLPRTLSTDRLPRNIILALIGGLMLLGTIVHLQLGERASNVTGPLAILDHIFDFTLALGLSILALGVGASLCKQLKVEFTGTAEALSFSLFVGTGILGLAVLFLGLLNLLYIWAVGPVIVLTVVLCRKSLVQIPGQIQHGLKTATLTRESRILTALFCLLVALLLLRTLVPPNTPDELIYHLPVPHEFAKRGSVYPSYDNLFGNLPFLINMIYVLCQMAGSDIAARVFSLFLAVSTAFGLYAFCARYLARRTGVIALFAFFGAGMVVEVSVTARIDVSLAGMLFLATYAMINHLETDQRGWMWVSAILSGFSLGIKSSAGPWLVVIGAMYLFEKLFRKRARWQSVLTDGIIYVILAAAIASPWYIKNYVWFHNPVYPFFTGEVADFGPQGIRYFSPEDERKLDAHLATVRQENPGIVVEQEQELRGAIDSRVPRYPMRFWDYFIHPDKYLVSEPFHLPNYLFLIIPLLLFVPQRRWILWQLAMCVTFFVAVTKSAWIARYLMPVYPSLTIVAVYTLCGLSNKLGKRFQLIQSLPVWATAISLTLVIIVCMTWVGGFNSLSFLSGRISRHDFLLQFPFYHRTDFINTQLPANAKVLAVGAHMNYGIERPYVTDESWFATKWKRLLIRNDSLSKVNDDLHNQGFTHILYCPGPFTYSANLGIKGSGGMDLIAQSRTNESELGRTLGAEYELLRNWSTFTLYRDRFLETLYVDGSKCEVLRIK